MRKITSRAKVVLWSWTFCYSTEVHTGCLATSLFPSNFCNDVLTSVCGTPKKIQFEVQDYNKTVVPLEDNSSNIYPEWSWDHVRTYVAIRRHNRYSNAQIRALASQDIVMLEKYNGPKTYGSTEAGTLQAAKRIKAVNPNVKILFYLNAMVHYSGKSYAANKSWKDEWAMFNPKRNRIYKWRKKWPCYDHRNLEFREWWIQRALSMVAHDEIDGVFIDGIVKTDRRYLPVKNHGKAYLATANELRGRLPAGKILIGNALRARTPNKNGYLEHLEYLDGSYLEGWGHKRNLAPSLDLMSAALKQGRIVMLNGAPRNMNKRKYNRMRNLDDRYDYLGKPEIISFSLGYFLLVAEPHAHLSYHYGVDANPRRRAVFDNTRFEAITRKLGKPLGDYVKNGNEYTREFEYLKVWVNLKTTQAVLTVKVPSGQPSESPSASDWPTSQPSESPSLTGRPSSLPSGHPSILPSEAPFVSIQPSPIPSASLSISSTPSAQPSEKVMLDWPMSMSLSYHQYDT